MAHTGAVRPAVDGPSSTTHMLFFSLSLSLTRCRELQNRVPHRSKSNMCAYASLSGRQRQPCQKRSLLYFSHSTRRTSIVLSRAPFLLSSHRNDEEKSSRTPSLSLSHSLARTGSSSFLFVCFSHPPPAWRIVPVTTASLSSPLSNEPKTNGMRVCVCVGICQKNRRQRGICPDGISSAEKNIVGRCSSTNDSVRCVRVGPAGCLAVLEARRQQSDSLSRLFYSRQSRR